MWMLFIGFGATLASSISRLRPQYFTKPKYHETQRVEKKAMQRIAGHSGRETGKSLLSRHSSIFDSSDCRNHAAARLLLEGRATRHAAAMPTSESKTLSIEKTPGQYTPVGRKNGVRNS
jgi:hypothetical protein